MHRSLPVSEHYLKEGRKDGREGGREGGGLLRLDTSPSITQCSSGSRGLHWLHLLFEAMILQACVFGHEELAC